MILLLDTCALLWAWAEPEKLSGRLQGFLQDPHNQMWVSAASAWEIATKHRIGQYPAGRHHRGVERPDRSRRVSPTGHVLRPCVAHRLPAR